MSEGMTRRRFVKIGLALAGTAAVGGGAVTAAAWAPEPELVDERMGDGMKKVLVVYGTGTGCTAGIAERIGKTLAEMGLEADVKPAAKAPAAEGYDAVIVGSGVRAGNWHAPVKAYVSANAGALKAKPLAFFTCGLTAQDPAKAAEMLAYTEPLVAETGVKPVDTGLFAGWFEPKKFSFVERMIMKAMNALEGDFRDFAAIEAWTKSVSGALGVAA